MIAIVWEYQVKPDQIEEFEKRYSSDGAWARLFMKTQGFLGTTLIHSTEHPQLYTTIDQWTSMKDYRNFLSTWKEEYEALDRQCESLTEYENCLGTFGIGFNEEE